MYVAVVVAARSREKLPSATSVLLSTLLVARVLISFSTSAMVSPGGVAIWVDVNTREMRRRRERKTKTPVRAQGPRGARVAPFMLHTRGSHRSGRVDGEVEDKQTHAPPAASRRHAFLATREL